LVAGKDNHIKFGLQIDSGHPNVTGAQNHTFGKIHNGSGCHLGLRFSAVSVPRIKIAAFGNSNIHCLLYY